MAWADFLGGFARKSDTGALLVSVEGASGPASDVTIKDNASANHLLVNGDGSINANTTVVESATAADAAAAPALFKVIAGYDGANVRSVKTTTTGILKVDVAAHDVALPAGTNEVGAVKQGTAAAAAGAWPSKLTDGTNTAAVKAASTAAAAADPAVVASLSPNSPLPIGTNTIGAVNQVTGGGKTLLFASISTAASGATAVVAAVTSKKIKVVSYALVATTAVNVKFQDGSTDITGAMPLAANGGVALAGQVQSHLMETSVTAALNINLSAAVQVSGHIAYFAE